MNKELQEKKEQLAQLQKEVHDLALAELEKAKQEGKSFDEIFELWLSDDVPKKKHGWLIHIRNVPGLDKRWDIWDVIDGGEPVRYKTYTVQEIVEQIEYCNEDYQPGERRYLSDEQVRAIKQELMDQDVGTTIFDW